MSNVNIVPLVQSIEKDYGSVNSAPIFDKRLIKARMLINEGTDPIESKKYYFDLELAQKLLDQGQLSRSEIVKKLNIGKRKFQGAIDLGLLSLDRWKKEYRLNHGPKYRIYKNGKYLTSGTENRIASEMHISTAMLRYYRSEKYKRFEHKVVYKLEPMEEEN